MKRIRVVWGTGTGPTELAAYDAALAAANVHDYNLIKLSSVIPADTPVEEVGSAPDLGPTGNGLYVVEASAIANRGPVSAALAWARADDGSGVFYEAAGPTRPETIGDRVLDGLAAGTELRDRQYDEPTTRIATTEAQSVEEEYACAAVLAAYGRSEPLLG